MNRLRLPQKVTELFFPFVLVVAGLFLFAQNYTPGTFLTGWDTLHPEFNFSLAFERVLNGVWRSDQGLGAVAIQSHMAELPRIVLLWLLSFIAPFSSLRYITMLVPLIVGPLGVYALLRTFLHRQTGQAWSSFLGALVYLTNLGTVQHFVVPLEMFAIHYGFLPWAILFALIFLEHGKRRNLLAFVLTTIALIPQAHTATLFYVYFVALTLSMITAVYLYGHKKMMFRAALLITMTVFINAFWLLPNLYAVKTQGVEVQQSRINRLFSGEAFAKNQLFGTPRDAAILKNFLFEWSLFDYKQSKMVGVVQPWNDHLNNPVVSVTAFAVFGMAVIGLMSTLRRRHKVGLILLPATLIAFLMLLNGTWPMNELFDFIGSISGTLKEALRFPFTKFSILFMLGLAVYAGFGIQSLLKRIHRSKPAFVATGLFCTLGLIFYFLPAFNGNLINPAMRIRIPDEYFAMFDWFKTQSKTDRVAILPIHSFWGWTYYDWGYQGAGFLQFGIPQPLLDRDHDRWSRYNEQYQREMTYALYSQNPQALRSTLEKYSVKWIIFDQSIIPMTSNENATLAWYIPRLLEQTGIVEQSQTFGETILVYKVTTPDQLLSVYTNIPDIGPTMIGASSDRIFQNIGLYKTDKYIDFDLETNNYTYEERYTGENTGQLLYEITSSSSLNALIHCGNDKTAADRSEKNDSILYTSTNGPLCDYFAFSDLGHDKSYSVEITSRNLEGFPLQVYICNDLSRHCGQIVHLKKTGRFTTETFVIPAYKDFGIGHTINFSNFAIRNQTSTNEVQRIVVREHIESPLLLTQEPGNKFGDVHLMGAKPGYITARLPENPGQTTLVFGERFHQGWHAYIVDPDSQKETLFPFLFGKELPGHVIINSWANSWKLTNSTNGQLVLFFVPQLLEWIGLAGIPISFLIFLKKRI